MIPISWIVFQKLLQDTLVNIRSKILGKIDLKNAKTLCRLTSVFNTSYSSVYVSFSTDKVNSFISTSFSAQWLFLYQKDIAMCLRYPQASSVATLPTGSILPPPPPFPSQGCILSPTWLYTTLPPPQKKIKTWLTNLFDSTVSVYFRNLLTLVIIISGMKNNGCLLKEAH